MTLTWQVTPEDAFSELAAAYTAAIRRGVAQIARIRAWEIERWMRSNRVWTDRTGEARRQLWAESFELTSMVVVAFGHGVEYGQFLEMNHGGRFAIIGPALDRFVPLIWNDVQNLLRG